MLLFLLLVALVFVVGRRCESPTVPSPRQENCSIKRGKLENWTAFQAKLASEAAAWRKHKSSAGEKKPPLLLLGDSITEALRGTAVGEVVKRTEGVEAVLPTAFSDWQSPLVLAISADETQHLLWRLREGGELPAALRHDPRLAISVLIGTNNLGNANHSEESTAAGILAVARELLSRTQGKLLLSALLPRSVAPPKNQKRNSPRKYTSIMPAVRRVNELVNASVYSELAAQYPGRVNLVDCGHVFAPKPNTAPATWAGVELPAEVAADLMDDALHPNVEGTRLWTRCVSKALAPWAAGP